MAARTTDPITSLIAAKDNGIRASQRDLLLAAYRKAGRDGLTPEQAATNVGLRNLGTCYWKRVSELKQKGLITPIMNRGHAVTKISRQGRPTMLYKITPTGRAQLDQLLGKIRAAVKKAAA